MCSASRERGLFESGEAMMTAAVVFLLLGGGCYVVGMLAIGNEWKSGIWWGWGVVAFWGAAALVLAVDLLIFINRVTP